MTERDNRQFTLSVNNINVGKVAARYVDDKTPRVARLDSRHGNYPKPDSVVSARIGDPERFRVRLECAFSS